MRTAFLAAGLFAAMVLPAQADPLIDFSITTDTGNTLSGEMDALGFSNPNDFVPLSI